MDKQSSTVPQTRLASKEAVNSMKIPSLHMLFARNTKFLKAHNALSLMSKSIDFDNRTSSFTPPHSTNIDLFVEKSTTMLLIAPSAATWLKSMK